MSRRLLACHHQLETDDIEAAAADAFFADAQHVPELFKLARLPAQQHGATSGAPQSGSEARMRVLLQRVGRVSFHFKMRVLQQEMKTLQRFFNRK